MPVRMAIIKGKEITSVHGCREKGTLVYTGDGIVNWYRHYGKQNGGSSKN